MKKRSSSGLTISVTSCNRMHYTRSLLKSLESVKALMGDECQLIVVDMGSTEVGLQEFIKEEKLKCHVDEIVLRTPEQRSWVNDEFIAKNITIDLAKFNQILVVQDDCQLVWTPSVFIRAMRAVRESPPPIVDVMAVRRMVVESQIAQTHVVRDGIKLWDVRLDHFQTMGVYDARVFDEFGSWRTDYSNSKVNWGIPETEFDRRIKMFLNGKKIVGRLHVPLFASIWNDPRGGYVLIRGNSRYGHYVPPPDKSGLYYKQLSSVEFDELCRRPRPASFSDVAKPIGWSYSVDQNGEQVKSSQDRFISEGPREILPLPHAPTEW